MAEPEQNDATGPDPGGEQPRGGDETATVQTSPAPAIKLPEVPGFRLTREISRGGQGAVFQGVQLSTGRQVAVKMLHSGVLLSDSERARFKREVQILAALNHPNIVGIIETGKTKYGGYFLAMNYIAGKTLDRWLEAYYRAHPDGPPVEDPSELLRLFLKICDAVNAAHLRGIVHRDLKPGNIMVDDRGEPHILDFGMAHTGLPDPKDGSPVTVTGYFLGSLPWASPEQAEGGGSKQIDTRTDVYSLGVILYQLLTNGKFPYEVVGKMAQVLTNIVSAAPVPPSARLAREDAAAARKRKNKRGTFNPVIDAIVLKALSKARENRYQTAGEFARDIGNYLSGRPTIAGGPISTADKWPVLARAGIIAAGVLVLVALLFWWARTNGSPPGKMQTPIAAPAKVDSPADVAPVANLPTPPTAPTETAPVPLPAPVPIPAARRALTNSIGVKLIEIPPGTFTMGTPSDENGRLDNEVQHQVTLTKGFMLGVTPITQAQWAKVMDHNPSHVPGDDLPVDSVLWTEAVEFCQRLSAKESRHYRLPTEAEWEYACRAGGNTMFDNGNTEEELSAEGWYASNSDQRPHPVGQKRPNAWGLYDMHGNVWQWCSDYFGPYPQGPVTDPKGPAEGESRVLRGGSWYVWFPRYCRAGRRELNVPTSRNVDYGLRLALDLPSDSASVGTGADVRGSQSPAAAVKVSPQVQALIEAALQSAAKIEDPHEKVWVYCQAAQMQAFAGEMLPASRSIQTARQTILSMGDEADRAAGEVFLAEAVAALGDDPSAKRIAADIKDAYHKAYAYVRIGVAESCAGRVTDSWDALHLAKQTAATISDAAVRLSLNPYIAKGQARAGDVEGALATLAQTPTSTNQYPGAYHWVVHAMALRGDLTGAQSMMNKATNTIPGWRAVLGFGYAEVADAQIRAKNIPEAQKALGAAFDAASGIVDPIAKSWILCRIAKSRGTLGQVPEAMALLETSKMCIRQTDQALLHQRLYSTANEEQVAYVLASLGRTNELATWLTQIGDDPMYASYSNLCAAHALLPDNRVMLP